MPGTGSATIPRATRPTESGSAAASMDNPPLIPGYRILRVISRGGMAAVYLAIQESFGREVALKVMSPSLTADPGFAERFAREARIVAQMHHSAIVPVFDV